MAPKAVSHETRRRLTEWILNCKLTGEREQPEWEEVYRDSILKVRDLLRDHYAVVKKGNGVLNVPG